MNWENESEKNAPWPFFNGPDGLCKHFFLTLSFTFPTKLMFHILIYNLTNYHERKNEEKKFLMEETHSETNHCEH